MSTRPILLALSTALVFFALDPRASAQDDGAVEEDVATEESFEPLTREILDAWVRAPADELTRNAASLTESAAFARIHDADDGLLELEEARRMVGYDLLDGVR